MELFKLFGTIAINNSDANRSLDETTGKAEHSHVKISAAFGKIGKAAVAMGTVMASGIAAGSAALVKLTKDAVASYADYEQLVGGVETLFKESSNVVMGYAENAYETAGLSANEYMETVTSFSASLLQGLGGDTELAAEIANLAITDMSDNANKMGTSMESIQNAYQGFAKQNYTMLDNLKLGYGGTQSEMIRLINDSGVLKERIDSLDNVSFDTMIKAIHEIQNQMDITGTTAKEASSTISGSIGMLKGAWSNFLTGLADENADLSTLMDSVIDSFYTAANNIAPKIVEVLPAIVGALEYIVGAISEYLFEIFDELLPVLLNGASEMVVDLIKHLPSLLKTLGSSLWNSLVLMFSEIGEMLPEKAQGAFGILGTIFQETWDLCLYLWETVGKPLFNAIKEIFGNAVQWISDNSEEIKGAIGTAFEYVKTYFSAVFEFWSTVWNTIGKPILDMIISTAGMVRDWFTENFGDIGTIVQNVFEGISIFWEEHLKPCFEAIGSFIENILAPAFEWVFKYVILPVIKFFVDFVENMWNNSLKPIFTGIIDFLTGVFSGDWKKAFEAIKTITEGILEGLKTLFSSILSAIWSIVTTIFDNIKTAISNKMNLVKATLTLIWESIKTFVANAVSSILNNVTEKFENIVSSISDKMEAAKNAVKSAIEKIKDFFNFEWHLPELKLPHIKIDGEWDLKEGKFPSFGVEWYKNGGVMTKPTAFGINPSTGNVMVGGEAGAEAIAPIDTLKGYVADAVANQNAELIAVLKEILSAILGIDLSFDDLELKLNKREFGRLVKAVN